MAVHALLFLFLLGLLVVGNAQNRRVASAGAWLTLLSGAALATVALFHGAEVLR